MHKLTVPLVVFSLHLVVPITSYAQGVVPCGNQGQPSCDLCHVVVLVQNVSDLLVAIMTSVFVIALIVGGIWLNASTGSASMIGGVKKTLRSVVVGFIVVLAGWIIVDLFVALLVGGGSQTGAGSWQALSCMNTLP